MKTKNWINEVYDIPLSERKGVTDYLYLLSKGVTEEARNKFETGDIFINGAVCLLCKDYIRSKNLHNFVTCTCGNLSVDGGSWYCKRNYKEEGSYINVIEYFNKD